MPFDAAKLRRDEFPWMDDGNVIYLNAASTGPLPARTVAAQHEFTTLRAQPHRITFEHQFGVLSRCRELLAVMIGARADEIALASNTGAGLNLAAWGLPLGVGDEVIVSDAEFPANVYPWHAAAEARGYTVHTVPTLEGRIDEEALLAALERSEARVLSVSWVGFVSGAVADLERLGAACRERDIIFVVDAIQGLGPLTLNVSRLPVDLVACGGQKWLLSPWGTGFTWVSPALMSCITPQPVSWMGVRDSDDFSRLLEYDLTWRDNARRFEQVTLAYQDFAGMAASLELLAEVGRDEVSGSSARHARALLEGARDAGYQLITPLERHAGIASIRPTDPAATSARLESAGVIHSLREGTIRLAPHCYSTDAEIARTIELL